MISNAILQDSLNNRGISLDEWCHENNQDYFYSFEKIKTIDKLEKWCLDITEEYLVYALNSEKKRNCYLIEKAKKIILQNLDKEISLSEIASQLYFHPNYLSRLFKKEVGLSITDYQIRLRIEKAKEILREPGVKVYEVAERVGYESVTYFNRLFKKEVGITPKEYQKNLSGS
jgi:two-component system response regulator YesN